MYEYVVYIYMLENYLNIENKNKIDLERLYIWGE